MKKEELEKYKKLLLETRARLRRDVSTLLDEAFSKSGEQGTSMPVHMADAGTDNFEQEFTLSLSENETEMLNLIEAALERIEDGTYGICVESGKKIKKSRLNAIPWTPYCVEYAEKLESSR